MISCSPITRDLIEENQARNDAAVVWHWSPVELIEDREMVHVWCCDLANPSWAPFCDGSTLDHEERERAQRLHSRPAWQMFIHRRALRRVLLGRWLAMSPQSLHFVASPVGKPSLSQPEMGQPSFSTSHSGTLFLMVISAKATVGVDIESVRLTWDWRSVAALFLDADRVARLVGMSVGGGQDTFLRFWTLREAISKASGSGIARSSAEDVPSDRVLDLIEGGSRTAGAGRLRGWNWCQRRLTVGSDEVVATVAVRSMARDVALPTDFPQCRAL